MRLRLPVCGWLCPIRAQVWGSALIDLPVVARAGGFFDVALRFILLPGDALGVDTEQDGHKVVSDPAVTTLQIRATRLRVLLESAEVSASGMPSLIALTHCILSAICLSALFSCSALQNPLLSLGRTERSG
jgi:hypothetical protein